MFRILIQNLILREEIPVTQYESYLFFEFLAIWHVYYYADKDNTHTEGEGRPLLLVCNLFYILHVI